MSTANHDTPQWPAKVAELVDYQEGAIVSRILMQGPGGSVTVFAFDRGQRLSEHTAPFDALVQIVDGTATVTVEGVTRQVAAGGWILLPANRPHAVEAPERCKMLLTMIRA